MYISATGNISAQKTFGHGPLLAEPVAYSGNRLSSIEPDYKEFIDAKLIRRMSRIIRMGVAAAMECLKEANVEVPDAIITGTAYGCLEDTGVFITKMVEQNEELLTPTAFIQSTHNTIGAQVGLMLRCNNYNNAFVHRGFSFESALLDGMMLLKEKEVDNVLIGAIDEITNISHTILTRMGLYKNESASSLDLFKSASRGTIGGEGSSFFLLSGEPSATDYARLDALKTFYKPAGIKEIETNISSFFAENSCNINDVDLLITGRNGDLSADKIYDQLDKTLFAKSCTANYKHLCGEYPTASSFALWLSANIIRSGKVPPVLDIKGSVEKPVKKILVYNSYLDIHHSLMLVSAC